MMTPDARTRARPARLWVLFCFGAIALGACGSRTSLYPVRGEVFVKGRPAEGALVVFHPVAAHDPAAGRPRGIVAADGSFQLSTYTKADGAPPGDYIVTINWLDHDKRKEEQVPDKLKGHYTSPNTSKLRI